MTRRHRASATFLLVSALTLGCGGGGGGDKTTKFVGDWTFTSGELTPVCFTSSLMAFSLAGLNVTFTRVDDATMSLMIGSGCTVHFQVAGDKATVAPSQTCSLDIGGTFGVQPVAITTWTLMLSGEQIENTIAGTVANGLCTASGTGVLVRGTSDAGVPRFDAARETNGQGGSSDAPGGAPDGGADVAADAAVDASADAPPEASSDAPAAETD